MGTALEAPPTAYDRFDKWIDGCTEVLLHHAA
jgi:hypothetical protein